MTEFDAGLLNLRELRHRIRGVELRDDTDYDVALREIGRGVAVRFEKETGRKLTRAVDAVEIRTGGTAYFSLERYPLETISAAEVQFAYGGDWELLTIKQAFEAAGIVYFESDIGDETTKVRFTVTGGYWHDDTEDSSGMKPDGATGLLGGEADDLADAFALQVSHEAIVRGVFSGGVDATISRIENDEGEDMRPKTVRLQTEVARVLTKYRKIT